MSSISGVDPAASRPANPGTGRRSPVATDSEPASGKPEAAARAGAVALARATTEKEVFVPCNPIQADMEALAGEIVGKKVKITARREDYRKSQVMNQGILGTVESVRLSVDEHGDELAIVIKFSSIQNRGNIIGGRGDFNPGPIHNLEGNQILLCPGSLHTVVVDPRDDHLDLSIYPIGLSGCPTARELDRKFGEEVY